MNTELIAIITELGFEATDNERVIIGIMVNKGYSFEMFVDTKEKTICLKISHDVMKRDLMVFQRFCDPDELKKLLLGNDVFIRFRSDGV